MADTDKNNGLLVTEQLTDTNLRQNENVEPEAEAGVNEVDMLNHVQALVEASEFPDGVQIQYNEGVGMQEGSMIGSNSDEVEFISPDAMDQVTVNNLSEHFVNGTYQILSSEQSEIAVATFNTEMNEMALTNGNQVEESGESGLAFQKIISEPIISTDQSETNHKAVESGKEDVSVQGGLTVTVSTPAPLGSSQNPIRIIQQGNQYTPVQQLSTDQLQQIMQVVQQQQQVTSTIESGSSVLFNPQTNTRIVYRVIYPSELHKDSTAVSNSMQTVHSMQATPKKIYKKRNKEEDTDVRDGPSLTKEEKEMRKKVRAKTRSGRISKPPKHMVKDFKHIHVLDYDEDYDDSDGGYSDYKVEESDEEEERSKKDDTDIYVVPGLNSMKPKNWKCVTCEKAYIGRAGLARHLKINPSHGSIDPEGDSDMVGPPPGTEIVMNGASSTAENTPNVPTANGTPNGLGTNSNASFSEDSRDSSHSLPYTPTPQRRGNPRGRPRGGRGWRGWRGRGAYNKIDPEIRRQNKLKDLIRECTDEELMEIVLPRLAKVITLWEFLLMKVEKGDPPKPHVDDIYKEYEKLHLNVKKLCQEYLQFIPETEAHNDAKILKVENTSMAGGLGLKTGLHKVKEIAEEDSSVTYKYNFLTTNHSAHNDKTNRSFLKRTVEVVSPEQIISPSKRVKNGSMKDERTESPQKPSVNMYTKPIVVSVSSPSASIQSTVLVQTNASVASPMSVSNTVPVKGVSSNVHTNQKNDPRNPKVISLLSNSILKQSNTPMQPKSSQPAQRFIIVSGLNSSSDKTSGTSQKPQAMVLDGNQLLNQDGTTEPRHNTSEQLSKEPKIDVSSGTESLISSKGLTLQTSFSNSIPVQSPSMPQSKMISSTSNNTFSETHIDGPLSSKLPIFSSDTVINPKITSELAIQSESVEAITPLSQESGNLEVKSVNSLKNHLHVVSNNPVITAGFTPPTSCVKDVNESESVGTPSETSNNQESDYLQHEAKSAADISPLVTEIKQEPDETLTTNTRSDDAQGVTSMNFTEKNGHVEDTCHFDSDSQFMVSQSSALSTDYAAEKFDREETELGQSEMYEYEDNSGETEQVETIQIPASNIFQTEDGAIFIQNHDGTFIQLQSSDGQNVSMETVQALLANDAEAQYLEEDNTLQIGHS